jgi:hypothetical protein
MYYPDSIEMCNSYDDDDDVIYPDTPPEKAERILKNRELLQQTKKQTENQTKIETPWWKSANCCFCIDTKGSLHEYAKKKIMKKVNKNK